MNHKQECYGRMFPPVEEIAHNKAVTGQVFGYRMEYSGQVVQKRETTADRDAWQKCMECRELDGCYRLSAGKLLMELAVKTSPQSLY